MFIMGQNLYRKTSMSLDFRKAITATWILQNIKIWTLRKTKIELRDKWNTKSLNRGIHKMSTPRSLPRHCHHVSAERRCFKTEKTNWGNCRESENGRGAASDLLGTWRGAGFSVLNWHRPVEEEGVRSRLALIRVTWDACLCQRVARGGQTDRQTIHYIEPLHSRRGLCGHYVYEKGLCGGSWLVVPVNRSLCTLGVCNFSVTIGLFYSAFAFDPTRCSAFARVSRVQQGLRNETGQSCASILNSADLDVLQDENHLKIRTLNWSKDQEIFIQ